MEPDGSRDRELERNKFRKLLVKYEHIVVRGYIKTRDITGKLSIRLENPDKVFQRHPYRLALVDREKLQEITD